VSTPIPSNGRSASGPRGVRILGTGSSFPKRVVTNHDLEKIMDTSDEWIVQRSGIHERRHHDVATGETTSKLASEAVQAALAASGMSATDLDLILVGTMTPECPTPSVACNVAHRIGAGQIGAMDLNAACSGFVFSLNLAHDLIRGGSYRTVAVVGADCITRHCDMTTYGRAVSVLFGDAAGAVVVQATDDASKGILAQAMHSDGGGARHLFIPSHMSDFPEGITGEERQLNCIQMNGQAVFKFAVTTFPKLIEQTLDMANVRAEEVDHYVCHQSNLRILDAARERFGLGSEKLHVNISKYGNTVGASVPLVLDDLAKAGRLKPGQKVMFLAFGAGLTWGSSLWQC
jgi:3-oxoacyl-[acyl-carrier-protein] synthase-3